MRPLSHEYPAYYDQYIEKVVGDNIHTIMTRQRADVLHAFSHVDETLANHRYMPGKWSVKEVLGHLNDSERIFGTRALCIARGETQPLPGFDENDYVTTAGFDSRSMSSLLEEWHTLRNSNVILAESLGNNDLVRVGIANGKPVTPRAVIWIIAGHTTHHMGILAERYGLKSTPAIQLPATSR